MKKAAEGALKRRSRQSCPNIPADLSAALHSAAAADAMDAHAQHQPYNPFPPITKSASQEWHTVIYSSSIFRFRGGGGGGVTILSHKARSQEISANKPARSPASFPFPRWADRQHPHRDIATFSSHYKKVRREKWIVRMRFDSVARQQPRPPV